MAEWITCKLSELGEIVGGATPSTKDETNYGGSISWITPKDLSTHQGRYIARGERNITEKGLHSCSTQIMPANSVLFSSRAPIGYVAIAQNELCTNQGFKSIVPNDTTDSMFLYYLLKYNKDAIEAMGSGTTFKEVSGNTMRNIEVRVPRELSEQKRIAAALSALDDKIENNDRVNNNLQQQARALYKSWFVDFEPFGGDQPSDWQTGLLKDVLKLQKNAIKPGENAKLPYLPIDTIPMNTFALTDVRPNEEAQSSLLKFSRDDIIIGAMRVYFHRVIIAPFDGITRTTCFVLTPQSPEYLAYGLLCCDQDSSIDFAQQSSKGSTMPYAVWDGGLGELEIPLPPKQIAEKFNALVMPMIREIQKSFFENSALRELRDALLPRLMSGEIDVSDVQI